MPVTIPKKCEYCSAEFLPNRSTHKFCCERCQQRGLYKRHPLRSSTWARRNKDRVKKNFELRQYGLTMDRKRELYASQDGKCPICRISIEFSQMYIDHDHQTGKVRGLLCRLCNVGLGSFKDNPASLRNAACYLEGH